METGKKVSAHANIDSLPFALFAQAIVCLHFHQLLYLPFPFRAEAWFPLQNINTTCETEIKRKHWKWSRRDEKWSGKILNSLLLALALKNFSPSRNKKTVTCEVSTPFVSNYTWTILNMSISLWLHFFPSSSPTGDAVCWRNERRNEARPDGAMAVHLNCIEIPTCGENGAQALARVRRVLRGQLLSVG